MNLINYFFKDMITNPNGSFSTKRVMAWFILIQIVCLSYIFVIFNVELSIITTIMTSHTTLFIVLIRYIFVDNKKYYDSLNTTDETITKDSTGIESEKTGL